jgi:hypothetical protein
MQTTLVVRVLSLVIAPILAPTAAVAQETEMPKGYVAEVTDTSGTKITVYGFSLGYTYSYTRSNCIGMCRASANATLDVLPLNEDCGATMVPFAEIRSISQMSRVPYPRSYEATITFIDGREVRTDFGSFGEQKVSTLQGQSALGAYSLVMPGAAQIVFQHEKNIRPVPEEQEWGSSDAKSNISIECPGGNSYSLSNATLYSLSSNGRVGSSIKKTLVVRVGASEITMDFDRFQHFMRNADSTAGSTCTLTTTAGGATDCTSVGEHRDYIGGFKDGHFYYVRLGALKSATVLR